MKFLNQVAFVCPETFISVSQIYAENSSAENLNAWNGQTLLAKIDHPMEKSSNTEFSSHFRSCALKFELWKSIVLWLIQRISTLSILQTFDICVQVFWIVQQFQAHQWRVIIRRNWNRSICISIWHLFIGNEQAPYMCGFLFHPKMPLSWSRGVYDDDDDDDTGKRNKRSYCECTNKTDSSLVKNYGF